MTILLDYLAAKYPVLLKRTIVLCKRTEVAEDVLQSVALRLLKNSPTHEIDNIEGYLWKMICHGYLNYKTMDRKYILDEEPEQNGIENMVHDIDQTPDESDSVIDKLSWRQVMREIMYGDLLGDMQRKVLLADINELPIIGNYDTLKANRRWGILKLREKFT